MFHATRQYHPASVAGWEHCWRSWQPVRIAGLAKSSKDWLSHAWDSARSWRWHLWQRQRSVTLEGWNTSAHAEPSFRVFIGLCLVADSLCSDCGDILCSFVMSSASGSLRECAESASWFGAPSYLLLCWPNVRPRTLTKVMSFNLPSKEMRRDTLNRCYIGAPRHQIMLIERHRAWK